MNKKTLAGMTTCGPQELGWRCCCWLAANGAPAPSSAATYNNQRQTMAAGTEFYCNVKALSLAERASHKKLTDRLIAVRTEIVEMDKGYEFQFSPSTMTLGELADWVAAEGKCCPFFDFHIDLEREGQLLCLQLTGEEGIKAFIRAQCQVPENQQ